MHSGDDRDKTTRVKPLSTYLCVVHTYSYFLLEFFVAAAVGCVGVHQNGKWCVSVGRTINSSDCKITAVRRCVFPNLRPGEFKMLFLFFGKINIISNVKRERALEVEPLAASSGAER